MKSAMILFSLLLAVACSQTSQGHFAPQPVSRAFVSADDLAQKLVSLREEIGHLKLKRATSRLENPMSLKATKRDLARVETILRERALRNTKG